MHSLSNFLPALVIFLCLQANASKTPPAEKKPVKPNTAEIVSIVFGDLDILLPTDLESGCLWAPGVTRPKLRDYIAFLTATLAAAEPKDKQTIRAKCVDYDSKKSLFPRPGSSGGWDCELMYSTVDNEGASPWSYGIKFRLNKGSTKIDPKLLRCPGSP